MKEDEVGHVVSDVDDKNAARENVVTGVHETNAALITTLTPAESLLDMLRMNYVANQLKEKENALGGVDREMAALQQRKVVLEAEIKLLREIQANSPQNKGNGTSDYSSSSISDPISPLASKHLGPVFRGVFTEMVNSFPRDWSSKEIRQAASKYGEVSDGFRTSLWNHLQRGNLVKNNDGNYRASEKTAQLIGHRWPVGS